MATAPDPDLERPEALRPGCAGVVPNVDVAFHERAAVGAAIGVDYEGGGGGHDGEGRGNGEAHVEEGADSKLKDGTRFSGVFRLICCSVVRERSKRLYTWTVVERLHFFARYGQCS